MDTVLSDITKAITKAIETTNERIERRFLPRKDLLDILDKSNLRVLFGELQVVGEEDLEYCVKATIGDDSIPRRALLALFMYQRRRKLLISFKDWLIFRRTDIPSDATIPFDEEALRKLDIREKYHRGILDTQTIFKHVIIRENETQRFSTRDRLPYLGEEEFIKNGTSGSVYKRIVAPGHWEFKKGNAKLQLNEPMVVALKTFRSIGGVSAEETTKDFEIERELLDKLHRKNFRHKAIMLHWGSIEVWDENNKPVHQSLIFELANFSLADFLKKDRCYTENRSVQSLILKKLADVVEALQCLHDDLEFLHLDIKPDNILVFEDNGNMTWKLSDFGLARDKKSKSPRTGHRERLMYSSSQPSTLLATRPAGLYQAPEIQESNSSLAGTGSDVWSMGCVSLLVLAFLKGGPNEVQRLSNLLVVCFLGGGGEQSLFYVRSDTDNWEDRKHRRYKFTNLFEPESSTIPFREPKMQAAIHPDLINWSNRLYLSFQDGPEQAVVKEALEVIFGEVLVVERKKRVEASTFKKRLTGIHRMWRDQVETQSDQVIPTQAPPILEPHFQAESSGGIHSTELLQHPVQPDGGSHSSELPQRPTQVDVHAQSGGGPGNLQPGDDGVESPREHDNQQCGTLCRAIKDRNLEDVRRELTNDPCLIGKPCIASHCQKLPLHVALNHVNHSAEALDILLENADHSVLGLRHDRSCGNRTALEEACKDEGSPKALRCFLEHPEKFKIDEEIYNRCKTKLSSQSGKLLKKLYKEAATHPDGTALTRATSRGSLFGLFRPANQ